MVPAGNPQDDPWRTSKRSAPTGRAVLQPRQTESSLQGSGWWSLSPFQAQEHSSSDTVCTPSKVQVNQSPSLLHLVNCAPSGLDAQKPSTLSTSAPAPSVRVDPSLSRRGTCDRGIWTKVAGVCGGRGPIISLLMGIEWSFRRLIASGVAEAGSMRNSCPARRALLSPKKPNCCISKINAGEEHAIASVAPATSSKSRLRSLTRSGIGQILNQRLVTTITASA